MRWMRNNGPVALALLGLTIILAGCGGAPTATPTPKAAGLIAFHSNRDGNYEIYVMNADGTGQTRLTNSPGDDGSPAWQPAPR